MLHLSEGPYRSTRCCAHDIKLPIHNTCVMDTCWGDVSTHAAAAAKFDRVRATCALLSNTLFHGKRQPTPSVRVTLSHPAKMSNVVAYAVPPCPFVCQLPSSACQAVAPPPEVTSSGAPLPQVVEVVCPLSATVAAAQATQATPCPRTCYNAGAVHVQQSGTQVTMVHAIGSPTKSGQ